MPSGTCSRRAVFVDTIMRLASFVGVGSLPASDRIKLAAPRLQARFSGLGSAEKRTLPRCYGMAVLRAAFPDGMTGEPIWSLQSMILVARSHTCNWSDAAILTAAEDCGAAALEDTVH